MCDRVVHRRSFKEIGPYKIEDSLVFDTTVDVFKVIYVDLYNGLPTIWYETLDDPVYRKQVELRLIFDNENLPDNSIHVGSTLYNGVKMVHIYQIMK